MRKLFLLLCLTSVFTAAATAEPLIFHASISGQRTPDVPGAVYPKEWMLVPARPGEKRIALVLVVSDYRRSGAASLPGVEHDARRIASALTAAGFVTKTALDLDLSSMRKRPGDFAAKSTDYDSAAIYTTGHGLESEGTVYLIPGDYPIEQGKLALRAKALPLQEIANMAHARRVNLVFYGGCRDDPF